MANWDHVTRLLDRIGQLSGNTANQSRKGQLGILNLRNLDLSDQNLSGFDLSCSDLSNANLSRAQLIGANLKGVDLHSANLRGANLSSAKLQNSDLGSVDLVGANLTKANLGSARLYKSNLSGAILELANLRLANLTGAALVETNLRFSKLNKADFSSADLSFVDFRNAEMKGTRLSTARVERTNFAGVDLSTVSFEWRKISVTDYFEPPRIYISHSRSDEELAHALAQELSNRGVTLFLGESKTNISKVLSQCNSMIPLMTEHSFSSEYVREELDRALFDSSFKKRVLPVMVGKQEDSRLPWVLEKLPFMRMGSSVNTPKAAKKIADVFLCLVYQQEAERK